VRHARGITLVEVLVVIAMIVLLLALLMPPMDRVREIGRRAVCASNLHQTSLAHQAWALDRWMRFVEGQPSYDAAHDRADKKKDKSKIGNSGHYAVWVRDWKNPKPTRGSEYGGKYTKHGALVAMDYLPTGRMFFCPSWTLPWIQYRTSGQHGFGQTGGGWFEDENEIPGGQKFMQTSYHYNSMFGSPDYDVVDDWRGANLALDDPTAALMADAFSQPKRGVDFHHVDGYNVLLLGAAVQFYSDPDDTIRDLNAPAGDDGYFAGKKNYRLFQSRAWRMFEGRP